MLRSLVGSEMCIRDRHDLGVPTQVDREGGLLERPAAAALEGLVQLVARPGSRHNAAWVARSPLFGMTDTQLHDFLSNSEKGEDLLSGLLSNCSNDRQRSLVSRWRELSSSGLVELLEPLVLELGVLGRGGAGNRGDIELHRRHQPKEP